MKEKISMVQLTKNQQKVVKGGYPECPYPENWVSCGCAARFSTCANYVYGWYCP